MIKLDLVSTDFMKYSNSSTDLVKQFTSKKKSLILIGRKAGITQDFTIGLLKHFIPSTSEIIDCSLLNEDMLLEPANIIVILQMSLCSLPHYKALERIFSTRVKEERALIIWIPYDRYTEELYRALCQYHGQVFKRVTDIRPDEKYIRFYVFNAVLKVWILEPLAMEIEIDEYNYMLKFLSLLPYDKGIFLTPELAIELNNLVGKCTAIRFPSTGRAKNDAIFDKKRLLEVPRYYYDGSVTIDANCHDLSWIKLYNSLVFDGAIVSTCPWFKTRRFPLNVSALLSYRRNAKPVNICSTYTLGQLWDPTTKMNVAAEAKVPLLGYWQASFQTLKEKYPVLFIGTQDFQDYISSMDYRVHIHEICHQSSLLYLNDIPSTTAWSLNILAEILSIL